LTNARKFMFETEFAADGTVLRDPTRNEFRRYEAKEVEALRAGAYEQGKTDALVEAERASGAALDKLAADMKAHLARLEATVQALRVQSAQIALAAARKIAGEALDQFGEARVIAAIEAAMDALPEGPRLNVRVAPGLEATLRERLEGAAKARGFEGAIVVRADARIAKGDVEIEWTEGALACERRDIEARVEALVAAALAASAEEHASDWSGL
jgi:flagellar assembly protein FliH